MNELTEFRKNVDEIDEKILSLLNKRAIYSQQIGERKRIDNKPIYVPNRETEVLKRLNKLNKGPLKKEALEAVYREIMSGSLRLEKNLQIAYLGPQFTFTHQASFKKFGSSVDYVPCTGISDVFLEVEHGRCDYGVVPVENSTEGAIYHTLDRFTESDLKIYSEVILRIQLNLLSKEDSIKKITKIYSNPQVFGQCRLWLETNLSGTELKNTTSTARAGEIVSKERNAACIASLLIEKSYGLNVLGRSIEDSLDNTTRFLVIAKESAKPAKKNKTSIIISLKDKVGALQRILIPFRKHGINLTKIESRPSKLKNWDYFFFIDFEAHVEDKKSILALRTLKKECSFVKILGSYPKADE